MHSTGKRRSYTDFDYQIFNKTDTDYQMLHNTDTNDTASDMVNTYTN